LEHRLKSSLYRNLFIFIAAFALAACSQKPATSEADMAELVFIGAGETKVIDRHGRCIIHEDLRAPDAHEGYYVATNKPVWLSLSLGDYDDESGEVVVRMSECP